MAPEVPHSLETPGEMLETIRRLTERVHDLEAQTGADSPRVYLNEPYRASRTPGPGEGPSSASGRSSSSSNLPPDVVVQLVDAFLHHFLASGTFFLDAVQFRQLAILPPSGGHVSLGLLSTVYLWGSVLSETPRAAYAPDAFLARALQHVSQDRASFSSRPHLILCILQAEILLSLYFLRAPDPVLGRHHCAAASALALGARLHVVRAPHKPFPAFPLSTFLLPSPSDPADELQRAAGFWAVVVLNNYWVAVDGGASFIPSDSSICSPWPSSSEAGATISKFLSGDDRTGLSVPALLVKSTILFERVVACGTAPPDPAAFSVLDRRLASFQAALPPLHTAPLTHAFVDLAILRLHAPSARASPSGRARALAAAARIIQVTEGINLGNGGAPTAEAIFGPICATTASFYLAEMVSVYPRVGQSASAQREYRELEKRLNYLMGAIAALAAHAPIAGHCLATLRSAYPGSTQDR